MIRNLLCGVLLLLLFSLNAFAQQSYSPYADRAYPEDVYWGDTHLHTNMSIDANGLGNKALSPLEAYRFARGEKVTAHNGMAAQLRRPLDFLVVADHAENLGVMPRLEASDPLLVRSETGKRWYKLMKSNPIDTDAVLKKGGSTLLAQAFSDWGIGGSHGYFWEGFGLQLTDEMTPAGHIGGDAFRRSVWSEVVATAERFNDPGKFTSFIGYEWSSAGRNVGGNLHRVVIIKDGASKSLQMLPYSGIDSQNPEDLWSYLQEYNLTFGGDAIAIPHNGNVSSGEMFSLVDFDGTPLNRTYAGMRSRWEPLYEITQIKGDGESHPILSPNDEFVDFETWNSWKGPSYNGVKTKGWKLRKEGEYARSALKLGLAQKAVIDVNPFKFGFIGSTDAHTSLAAITENNYWGKVSILEPSSFRAASEKAIGYAASAAGYAAVWAHENTRESLFAALKRKEVYATTGPRITLRFFGGWEYDKNDAFRSDLAAIGYDGGVPMGGDLTTAPAGEAPKFLIRAVRDPDGANLDRVQVIKGWRSEDGELHEKVYDVALSDDRKIRKNKRSKPVGSTVDVEDASYTNTIGDPELAVVWEDPDFDADELAFYYVRVIEIPTPRWTAYDAKFFDIPLKDIPDEVPLVTQERAYSSPIWYTPS